MSSRALPATSGRPTRRPKAPSSSAGRETSLLAAATRPGEQSGDGRDEASGDGRTTVVDTAPMATTQGTADEIAALFPPAPSIEPERGARAYQAWTEGATVLASDNELLDLAVRRCVADLRLL